MHEFWSQSTWVQMLALLLITSVWSYLWNENKNRLYSYWGRGGLNELIYVNYSVSSQYLFAMIGVSTLKPQHSVLHTSARLIFSKYRVVHFTQMFFLQLEKASITLHIKGKNHNMACKALQSPGLTSLSSFISSFFPLISVYARCFLLP